MTETVNDILSALKNSIKDNFSVSVWLPSTDNFASFKPINISQQKLLLKSVLDVKDIYNIEYITTFFNIIKENYLENNFDKLTILDEFLIFLQLRININKELIYTQDNKIYKKNLEQIVDLLKKDSQIKNFLNIQEFKENNIYVTCKIPTLQINYECERDKDKINVEEEDISQHIYKFIVNTISDELIKFVHKITIDNKEFNLLNFSYKERLNILNQLPASLIDQVIKYVTSYKSYIEKYMSITVTNVEDADDIVDFVIPYNGLFFIT